MQSTEGNGQRVEPWIAEATTIIGNVLSVGHHLNGNDYVRIRQIIAEAYSQSGAGPKEKWEMQIDDAVQRQRAVNLMNELGLPENPARVNIIVYALNTWMSGAGSPEETCGAQSSDKFVCNLKKGHEGRHEEWSRNCLGELEGHWVQVENASSQQLAHHRLADNNAKERGAASSSQSAAPTEPKGEQNGDCVDSSVRSNTGDSPSIGPALSDKKIGDLEQCPSCGSRYKCYFKWPNCHALGKHESWHSSVSKSAPEPAEPASMHEVWGDYFLSWRWLVPR